MKPLIGLVGRRTTGDKLIGNLGVLSDSPVDLFYAEYAQGVIEAGGLPVYLPMDVTPSDVVGRLDGLLMTGGTDIAPDLYGAKAHPGLLVTEPERDAFELAVLDAAYTNELPTLGICRGLQIINVHAGGTLLQHVAEHARIDGRRDDLVHDVLIDPQTTLADVYGEVRKVNSLHHQAADRIGRDLRVVARADDGGIEAIEHTRLPVVAVQWHPEMLATRAQDPIFSWLIGAAQS